MRTRFYDTYGFVDGGYLRKLAGAHGIEWVSPGRLVRDVGRHLAYGVDDDGDLHRWASLDDKRGRPNGNVRVIYYDAENEGVDEQTRAYWTQVGREPDTTLAFGDLKARLRGGREQKRVDVQLSVDMLTGAFNGAFDVAVLLSGDADFIPLVEEVRRQGVMVVLTAGKGCAEGLRHAADRYVSLDERMLRAHALKLESAGTESEVAPNV